MQSHGNKLIRLENKTFFKIVLEKSFGMKYNDTCGIMFIKEILCIRTLLGFANMLESSQ